MVKCFYASQGWVFQIFIFEEQNMSIKTGCKHKKTTQVTVNKQSSNFYYLDTVGPYEPKFCIEA